MAQHGAFDHLPPPPPPEIPQLPGALRMQVPGMPSPGFRVRQELLTDQSRAGTPTPRVPVPEPWAQSPAGTPTPLVPVAEPWAQLPRWRRWRFDSGHELSGYDYWQNVDTHQVTWVAPQVPYIEMVGLVEVRVDSARALANEQHSTSQAETVDNVPPPTLPQRAG